MVSLRSPSLSRALDLNPRDSSTIGAKNRQSAFREEETDATRLQRFRISLVISRCPCVCIFRAGCDVSSSGSWSGIDQGAATPIRAARTRASSRLVVTTTFVYVDRLVSLGGGWGFPEEIRAITILCSLAGSFSTVSIRCLKETNMSDKMRARK